MRTLLIWPLALLAGCTTGATPDIAPIGLTPTEYNNTVRDLLGMPDDSEAWPAAPDVLTRLSPASGTLSNAFFGEIARPAWPWIFPAEIGVDGFEGLADGQEPSAYQLEELQKAAIHFGSYALASPTFFQCEGWETLADSPKEACAWESLSRFAHRAWRRPLTDPELARLQTLWNDTLAAGPIDEAVALTAAGVLQAPAFVYRIEVGEEVDRERARVRLTSWELASRLSYFLWDTMPDAALFEAADSGKLQTRSGIRRQVRRMLEDPRAVDAVVHFHSQWLETDQVSKIAPAQRAYGPLFGLPTAPDLGTADDGDWPSAVGPLRASMAGEAHLFIAKTLFEGDGTYAALMSDHHGYLSSASMPVYGSSYTPLSVPTESWTGAYISASGTVNTSLTMQPVEFSPDERAGLLTLPAVLAVGAHPVHPSPVLRGKRILERVLCSELGSPPPGAEGARPPDTVDAEATNRERMEAVTSPATCTSCHTLINPAGFAFEFYDSLGRHRTTDNGQPVDGSGTLYVGQDTLTFTSGVDLARQLSVNAQARRCYAERWSSYALGYPVSPDDPDVALLVRHFDRNDHVLGLLEEIATSELFRYRSLGGTP